MATLTWKKTSKDSKYPNDYELVDSRGRHVALVGYEPVDGKENWNAVYDGRLLGCFPDLARAKNMIQKYITTPDYPANTKFK